MVLLLASFQEFTLFLQIVLWIAVPLIVVSFVVTTIFHYRQKKKNALLTEDHPDREAGHADGSIVSRLQKEVVYYRKKIKELQNALTFVKQEVPGLAGKIPEDILKPEPAIADTTSTNREVAAAPPSADSPATGAYLQDFISEQKSHIQFLQQQLETRIKNFHELEQQFRESSEQMERISAAYEHARHQLDDQEAAASMVRIERDALAAQVGRLEKSLQELQHQQSKTLQLLDKHQGAGSQAIPGDLQESGYSAK
jgi:DNA repair exonuclease SbcCD ATPase subunit